MTFPSGKEYDYGLHHLLFFGFVAFLDSVCNDFCAHILCFETGSSSFEAAGSLIAEQAARAADELAQHDVASSVLQAGPTSAARAEEIARRERAARRAIGTAQEADAFAHLRSAVAAEARRINGLMYCARLRCLIMPIRFDVLVQLASVSGAPRQPSNPEATDYLGWLLDEAARVRPIFLKRIE